MLRRFGFQLAGRRDVRNQRQVYEQRIFTANVLAHLANGFKKRQRLDIANRAPDFDDRHVHVLSHAVDRGLNLVRDVRNHLNRLAKIIAAPLLLNDRFIDAAGGEVVLACKFGVGVALVMSEIEVGFSAIVCNVHLAVLVGTHCPRIDV